MTVVDGVGRDDSDQESNQKNVKLWSVHCSSVGRRRRRESRGGGTKGEEEEGQQTQLGYRRTEQCDKHMVRDPP